MRASANAMERWFFLGDKNHRFIVAGRTDLERVTLPYFGGFQLDDPKQIRIALYAMAYLRRIVLKEEERTQMGPLSRQLASLMPLYLKGKLEKGQVEERILHLLEKLEPFMRRTAIAYLQSHNRRSIFYEILARLRGALLNPPLNEMINDFLREHAPNLEALYQPHPDYMPHLFRDGVELFPHQLAGIYRFLHQGGKRMALFWEPRLGKTLPALYAILHSFEKGARCAVVIAPLRTLQSVWVRQFREFFQAPSVDILDLSGLSIQERYQLLIALKNQSLNRKIIFLFNYETFSRLNLNYVENCGDFIDVIVLDEVHKIKDPQAKATKVIHKMFFQVPIKIVLTGTPYGNSELDTWSILRFLYDAPFGCSTLNQFIYRYGFRERYRFVLTQGEIFHRDLLLYADIRRQADLGIQIPQVSVEILDMTPPHQQIYQKIVQSLQRQVEVEQRTITVSGILSLIQKLSQVSSGFYYVSPDRILESDVIRFYERMTITKWQYLMELIEENIAYTPLVICLQYEEEYRIVSKMLEEEKIPYACLIGGMPIAKQNAVLERFQNGEVRVLLVNPRVASLGIDLSIADLTIYPSTSYSLIEERQMRDRTTSPTKQRAARVIFLAHANTIDVVKLQRLAQKRKGLDDIMALSTVQEILSTLAFPTANEVEAESLFEEEVSTK